MTQAAVAAMDDAGMEPGDIDGLSTMGGFAIANAWTLGITPLNWFLDAELGPAFLYPAVHSIAAIQAGLCHTCIVIRLIQRQPGSVTMPPSMDGGDGSAAVPFPFGSISPTNWAGLITRRHMIEYGTTEEQFAAHAVTQREHARLNDDALVREPFTVDDYLATRYISKPVRILDCDYPCDAGSAVIFTTEARAAHDFRKPPVFVESYAMSAIYDGFETLPDMTHTAPVRCAETLWSRTDLGPADVDSAQLYDGFTIITFQWLEALGLCGSGRGRGRSSPRATPSSAARCRSTPTAARATSAVVTVRTSASKRRASCAASAVPRQVPRCRRRGVQQRRGALRGRRAPHERKGDPHMKLISYSRAGVDGFGAVVDDDVVDLTGSAGATTLVDLLGGDGLDAAHAAGRARRGVVRAADCTLLPPIPRPTKILCVGVNYVAHAAEAGREVGEYPVIFQRYAETLVPHGGALRATACVRAVRLRGRARGRDREGRRAHRARATRWRTSPGYTCFNDASVRDWQFHTRQYGMGKNFLGSGGFGPWLVTADEVPDHHTLRVRTVVSGEELQNESVDKLAFDIPYLISYTSQALPWYPGDVLSTGTPAGVGLHPRAATVPEGRRPRRRRHRRRRHPLQRRRRREVNAPTLEPASDRRVIRVLLTPVCAGGRRDPEPEPRRHLRVGPRPDDHLLHERVRPARDRPRAGNAFPHDLVFLSSDPDEHHQLVLVSGRPEDATFSTVMQLSFKVDSLADDARSRASARSPRVRPDLFGLNHGNAWSIYCKDPEGNTVEVYVDTPWYVPQPFGHPLDLTKDDADDLRGDRGRVPRHRRLPPPG